MSYKKSVAFVANTSWSIYKFRLYLIKELIGRGFNIYVLAPRDPYTVHLENQNGLTYIELKNLRGKSISPIPDIQLYRELYGHYQRIRPDVIFHYTIKANIFGTLASSRLPCPSISVITGLGYTFSGNRVLQSIVKQIYKRVLRKNMEVWFLNKDDKGALTKNHLVKEEKTFLLPGEGVDSQNFYPAPYEPGKREVTFLLIARIIRHKGILEYVKAAELLQARGLSVRFQLLGFFDDGSPVAISREQVVEWKHHSNIQYLGHTDDVAPFIASADCIVLPSYREGLPLSLLEGASMCKALIATDTAGCREIIEDGVNGYLCRKKDAIDLAEKMEKFYHLPPVEKRQMGLEGRKKILDNFTEEIVAGIYLDKLKAWGMNGQSAGSAEDEFRQAIR